MKRIIPFLMAAVFCGAAFAQPDDLLISEYVEGSSFNKAIELYNGTGSAIDLEAERYYLRFFFNGNTTAGTSIALSGTVADGDVFVLAEDSADPAILAEADQLSGDSFFNGDDAVVLFRDSTMIVDAIGQVGFDPGSEWGMGDTSTQDNTLRRQSDACIADADTSDVFDPAEDYIGFPNNTFDGLGSASFDCGGGGPNFDLTASLSTMSVPQGGSFTVNFSVTNNTNNPVTGDVFYTASPGGILANAINDQTVQANSTRSGSYVQSVPGAAPPGMYTYTVRIGQFPGTTVDSEVFSVLVTAARTAVASMEWSVVDARWHDEIDVSAAARAEGIGAYPNPFASHTEIAFSLERASDVSLVIYDVRGREVAHLADEAMEAGQHSVTFDAASLPSGVYVYRLTSGAQVETGRITLVR